jgi:hypothetical protein
VEGSVLLLEEGALLSRLSFGKVSIMGFGIVHRAFGVCGSCLCSLEVFELKFFDEVHKGRFLTDALIEVNGG